MVVHVHLSFEICPEADLDPHVSLITECHAQLERLFVLEANSVHHLSLLPFVHVDLPQRLVPNFVQNLTDKIMYLPRQA